MIVTQDIVLNNYFRNIIVLGGENLPLQGPVILAPTHRARWDALMLTMAAGRRITNRDCRFMVTRSEMKGLQGWFLNRLGCFPVDQDRPRLNSLRYSMDLLINGHQLVVFPEGKINRNSAPISLHQGIVRLSQLVQKRGVQVNIVPIGLAYSQVIPRPMSKACICFSEPIKIYGMDNEDLLSFNSLLSSSMKKAEIRALKAVGRN